MASARTIPKSNAIVAQGTPHIDALKAKYSVTQIGASGLDVGLPDGQMGNSEVGHTNIGAGRVVYQMLVKITKDIKDGVFFENPALLSAMKDAAEKGTALHLIGLVSDGGVHSHQEHLYGLIEMAKHNGVSKVYVHALLDGRDVPPDSGLGFVEQLVEKTKEIGLGKVATVMGRFYAMDRDFAWDRVSKSYAAMVCGEGVSEPDPVKAVADSYAKGVMDEFVLPTVCDPEGAIRANDSVVFFNFRPDRAREISRAFVDPDFTGFERKKGFFPLHYVCMTQYDETMPNVTVAYPPEALTMTMGEYLSKLGKTQLRIAETQKYAHVTFFFNGGEEKKFPGEDRILIPSPKVETFDLKPEMSAYEVKDAVIKCIDEETYDVIILNFANCDMVGHTGFMDAAKAAVKAVDLCVGEVVDAILAHGGKCVITADHGNADQMIDEQSGGPFTAHTTNPRAGDRDRPRRAETGAANGRQAQRPVPDHARYDGHCAAEGNDGRLAHRALKEVASSRFWPSPEAGFCVGGHFMEQWDAYDRLRRSMGYTIQRGAAKRRGEMNLVVHIAYYNSRGEILVQRRADDKDYKPGIWAFTAGAVIAGETSAQACVRETKEELGFLPDMETAMLPISFMTPDAFVDVYAIHADVELSDMRLQKSEVAQVAWLNREAFLALARDKHRFWQYHYMDMLIRIFDETDGIWTAPL